MRDIEGMSTDETAKCLGTSARNVKVLLHRARAGLRKKLYKVLGAKAPDLFRFHAPRCDRVVHTMFKSFGNRGPGQPANALTALKSFPASFSPKLPRTIRF
jgi:RNA polymerase sigma-70 factor (ECF subfamily)